MASPLVRAPRPLLWIAALAVAAASVAGAAAAQPSNGGADPDADPAAALGSAALEAAETVRPAEVVDGDTLVLADGRLLRLALVEAPKPPLDALPEDDWPLAAAARAALAARALGRDWRLAPAGTTEDRYGRRLGHLVDGAGRWLNAELVSAGLARVVSRLDLRLGAAALLEAERRARERRVGLWSVFAYRVLPAEEARFGLNRFALVEGRVRDVADVRGRTYLNFGDDWREDFTVSLDAAARRLFEREGRDPADYRGRRIRVRGWVLPINGPMIEVSHPEQIEVLE